MKSSSERLFSCAGLFKTTNRNRMKWETMDILTLMKSNQHLIDANKSEFEETFPETIDEEEDEGEVDDDLNVAEASINSFVENTEESDSESDISVSELLVESEEEKSEENMEEMLSESSESGL